MNTPLSRRPRRPNGGPPGAGVPKLEARFAEVVARPDDDAPRLAYADECEAQGDAARATFVRTAVAHHGARGARSAATLRALLDLHRRSWLGTVADVIAEDYLAFERGFLSTCLVGPSGAGSFGGRPPSVERVAVPAAVLSHPAWRTVQRMKWFGVEEQVLDLLPAMPGLRHLENVEGRVADKALGAGLLEGVETLDFYLYEEPPPRFMHDVGRAPRLSSLRPSLLGEDARPPVEQLRWLVDGPMWKALREVDVDLSLSWAATLLPWLGETSVRAILGPNAQLLRDGGGARSLVLHTEGRCSTHDLKGLAAFPTGSLQRIVAWGCQGKGRVTSWLRTEAGRIGAGLEIHDDRQRRQAGRPPAKWP
ncbi:MAG: TIGR02996 domain-containing protein [Polyangiaceae bacterium]|nr:TIGR02996 domain-containing protein [Polyangiaceae bacterium]